MPPTRRAVIASALAAPALALPALRSPARAEAAAEVDLAVVGAGAAGIGAAHEARRLGLTCVVLEARDRAGGRVHTDASLGLPFEAGALYVHWAERNPWAPIARAHGFRPLDDNALRGRFAAYDNGRGLPEALRARRRRAFGRVSELVEASAGGPDASIADLARGPGEEPEVLAAAAGLTLLSLGEEPDRVSAQDYRQLDGGEDLVLPGGYGTLVARHAEGLPLRLSTPVSAIDWSGPGVALETPAGTLRARAAIVTASVGVLAAGAIRFAPALPPAHLAALDGLRMGALTKVALRLDGERFGLPDDSNLFDVGEPGGLVNLELFPLGRDLVIAYQGGDKARALAASGEAAAVAAEVDRLVAILGGDARRHVIGGRLRGWSEDPLARGSYSIARPGSAGARAALGAPIGGNLWLAGEATAGPGAMTAGGATLAGEAAARAVAAALRTGGLGGLAGGRAPL